MNGRCTICGEWDIDDLHNCKEPKAITLLADIEEIKLRKVDRNYPIPFLYQPEEVASIIATVEQMAKLLEEPCYCIGPFIDNVFVNPCRQCQRKVALLRRYKGEQP